MMKLRGIVMLILVLCGAGLMACANDYFAHLDKLISEHDTRIASKKSAIDKIKNTLPAPSSDPAVLSKEYDINSSLYREYLEFQNDSAQKYVRRNIAIATDLNDNSRLIDSRLNLMHLLNKAYLLDEASTMVNEIDTTNMSRDQKLFYYKILSDMCMFRMEFNKGSSYEKLYQQQLTDYRLKIANLSEPGSERNKLYHANYLNDTGKTREAIALLEEMLKDYHSGDRTYSVVTSTLAFYYSTLGDREKQKQLLAMSAASDIEGCIMENSALRQLAELLFDEGDIDRAYRYINISVADANFYGTRLRNVQASQLVPRIISAYQEKQEKNYRNMRNLIIALSVLALLLVAGVIALTMLYKRYRRLSESRKRINDKLNDTVGELETTNELLRERDKIKEQYLGRFLTFSSALIDKNENQRKAMNRLAMEDRLKELKSHLKSPHFDYENAKLFYQNFDSAFLNIYPNFIEAVNNLLTPDQPIEPKEDEQLTRELRILALIRLGITDNKEIASILRASIATIYTYRSRLKARAINKDTFEDDIKRIQALS
ncbi:MAG: hypothetical protein IKW83_08390 [Muribaculaceae bacterium]|nr:hypothetical protein [Muribaculaceae bacterium]